jgi:urocanate hydratase
MKPFLSVILETWLMFRGKNLTKKISRIDLGSDQTSLHNPWAGGYYPADISN